MTKSEFLKLTAKAGRRIVVIEANPGCWGSGATGKEAYANAYSPRKFQAFDCPENFSVDPIDGTLRYNSDDVAPQLVYELLPKLQQSMSSTSK